MAVLHACGWGAGTKDFYVDAGWTIDTSHDLVTTLAKRHIDRNGRGATYALEVDTNSPTITPTVSTSARWAAFYAVPNNPGSPQTNVLHFINGSLGSLWVRFYSNGLIDIARGAFLHSVTVLDTSTDAINPNVGHWIAVYAHLDSAAGLVEVYVDGTLMVDATGNTQGAGSPGWTSVAFAHNGLGSGGITPDWSISDVVILDGSSTLPPELFSEVQAVTGLTAGNLVGSPTTGANRYQNIDEGGATPASKAEYNEGTVSGDADQYPTDTLTLASGQDIYLRAAWAWVERAGALSLLELGVNPGLGVDYAAAQTISASGWSVLSAVWVLDPDTSDPWQNGAVDVAVRFT